MRTRTAVLVAGIVLMLPTEAMAQGEPITPKRLPYRLAVGFNPAARMPEGYGLSASIDLYSRPASRFVARLDATVLSADRHLSALTVDAIYGMPLGRIVAYPLIGLGIPFNEGLGLVGGAGVDFTVQKRTLFSELRVYRGGGDGVMKLGIRF